MTTPEIMTPDINRIRNKFLTVRPGDESTVMVELKQQYLAQNWIQSLAVTGIVHYLNKE
jgi:hypothetical protein